MVHLLLVEDEAEIRRSLIRSLRDRGHVVSSTATGLDAVQQVVDGSFELIVLDLGLPDIDGRAALRMIRAVSAVPVIV